MSEPSYPASINVQAFFSSSALQRMNSITSGWSELRITIFAARRVLPPERMTPAKASKPRMKETGPEARPPEERGSREERSAERLEPVPEPPLNRCASTAASCMIESIESLTELMKHAEHCGCSSMPTLNQTGLLKAAYWFTSRHVSSSSNVWASVSLAKYPPWRPQPAMVPETRWMTWRTLVSRSGVPTPPRKYLETTTFVAVGDQNTGTSIPFCSKTISPFSFVIEASRRSHDTASSGSIPGAV